MLLNPFTTRLPTIPGTRMLEDSFGLQGYTMQDPKEPWRLWTIQWLYAPIPKRALGGLRAKLVDQNDFVTFCNQRDLEVLLGYGEPGRRCAWTKERYPAPEDREWIGFCADYVDLLDDLHERELRLRNGSLTCLEKNTEIVRNIHHDAGSDCQELLLLKWDADPETNVAPDCRLETIERRWASVERLRIEWG